jgi:histone H3/H4
VPEALNKKVNDLLKEAALRAKANGRRTLQARDL